MTTLTIPRLKKAAARHPLIAKDFQPKKKRQRSKVIKEVKEIVYVIEKPKEKFIPFGSNDNFIQFPKNYLTKKIML